MKELLKDFEKHEIKITVSDEANHTFIALFRQRSGPFTNSFTSNGYMTLIINGGTLAVIGDYGDAIYQWNERLTWKWLADMDIQYFESKCQASEEGRRFVEWEPKKAVERLKYYLYVHVRDLYNDSIEDDDTSWEHLTDKEKDAKVKVCLEKYHLTYPEMVSWCEHPQQLSRELDEFDGTEEIFGSDYWEWLDCGYVPAYRCKLHLAACKAIYNKMEDLRNHFSKPQEFLTKVRNIKFPGKAVCRAIIDSITTKYHLDHLLPDVIEADLIHLLSSSEYEYMFQYVIDELEIKLEYLDILIPESESSKFDKGITYEALCEIMVPGNVIEAGSKMTGEEWVKVLVFEVGSTFDQMFKVVQE